MKYYRFTAKLLSPMSIQQKRQSNTPSALAYLPGVTLRGALAGKLLRQGMNPEDEQFQSLFFKSPAAFPNLIPGPDPLTDMGPLPASTISCKRAGGFFPENHGVLDSLSAVFAGRIGGKIGENLWRCPKCGEDMKPFSGFWNQSEDAPRGFEPTLTSQRHTGIDRTTGTVAPSIFFMTQSIADHYKDNPMDADSDVYQPQHLTGCAYLEPEQAKRLESHLDGSLFVGAERTRGMGEIQMSIAEATPPTFNLLEWDAAFRKKYAQMTGSDVPVSGLLFSVLLESHAILVDRFLRPTSVIEVLEGDGPGETVSDIAPVVKMTSAEMIRGWQSAWNLAKPDDMAVAMGSVYLFQYTGNDPAELEKRLRSLVVSGIGLRREEGFGKIQICNSLHIKEEML